jgi:hypothetical protein
MKEADQRQEQEREHPVQKQDLPPASSGRPGETKNQLLTAGVITSQEILALIL